MVVLTVDEIDARQVGQIGDVAAVDVEDPDRLIAQVQVPAAVGRQAHGAPEALDPLAVVRAQGCAGAVGAVHVQPEVV